MIADLRELYQDLILDHGKNPRNHRELADPNGKAEGNNPLCGDRCTVYLNTSDDTVSEVTFLGKGCAISQASASLMTQITRGKSRLEIQHLADLFQKMVRDEATESELEELGKLAALAGVKDFPSRVKCATLPWHTLLAALNHASEPVTTE